MRLAAPSTLRSALASARLIELPWIVESRGNLCFGEVGRHVPFAVRRFFFIRDIPEGLVRGRHAHREQEQFVVAVSGGFDVTLTDGTERRSFSLDAPWRALHIPAMVWGELMNFTPGAVALVLASGEYDEADYYRDYDEYLAACRSLGEHPLP